MSLELQGGRGSTVMVTRAGAAARVQRMELTRCPCTGGLRPSKKGHASQMLSVIFRSSARDTEGAARCPLF